MVESKPLVLTVDDDPDLAAIISLHIRRWGFEAHSVGSADRLWTFLERRVPETLLLDVMLGEVDGSQLVAEVKAKHPQLPVIMITRSISVEAAVRCMKRGATDYITKPLDFHRLREAVTTALEVSRFAKEALAPRSPKSEGSFPGIVGSSVAMLELFRRLEAMAPTDVSALILGETGTGKELVARAIHQQSRRRGGPFVAVNAAAIPHDLIESSLFGHEKGAFTGALAAHAGFCEQAEGGTLFLDEIAEMSFDVQAKLLRFLQDHIVQRVGSREARKVDVRVLAATNVDPLEQIARQNLREDLYYRLRVVSLKIPPLREREGDLVQLATHFLLGASLRHGREFSRLVPASLAALESYSWPGNVRELENIVEEAVVLHQGEELTLEMLPAEIREAKDREQRSARPESAGHGLAGHESRSQEPRSQEPLKTPLPPRQQAEMERIVAALLEADGDPQRAAESLGISRATIYRKMKKYAIER
ncbi:MAG: sigma-54 dependent transcriptional regulator [Deltaproteobacteria bacterium]|nr:sigma-54 dependent transcriptional regulator [Deltaproteobacteria bacterium]